MQWKTERSWQCARDMRKEVELMQTHGIVKCKSVWPVVSYLKRAVCDSRCFEAESKTFQSEREPRRHVPVRQKELFLEHPLGWVIMWPCFSLPRSEAFCLFTQRSSKRLFAFEDISFSDFSQLQLHSIAIVSCVLLSYLPWSHYLSWGGALCDEMKTAGWRARLTSMVGCPKVGALAAVECVGFFS